MLQRLVFPFCDYRTVCIEDLHPTRGLETLTRPWPVLVHAREVPCPRCCPGCRCRLMSTTSNAARRSRRQRTLFSRCLGIMSSLHSYGHERRLSSQPRWGSLAIIGNHVRLIDEVVLEGAVILGDRVMVDRRTTLRNAIVIDHTYVGSDLESDKIVCRDRIIGRESNTVPDLGADRLFMECVLPVSFIALG